MNVKSNLLFSTELIVQVNHLNYGNHLGYDAALSILQEARLRWLKTIMPSMSEINIENNIGWVVKDLQINYNSEARHADQLIVNLYLSNVSNIRLCLDHEITNTTSGKNLCNGKISLVFFDFNLRKPAKIPKVLLQILQKLNE